MTLRHVLPLLTACSQWTLTLLQKEEVAVPLLRAACKSLEKSVLAVEEATPDMSVYTSSRQILTEVAEDL